MSMDKRDRALLNSGPKELPMVRKMHDLAANPEEWQPWRDDIVRRCHSRREAANLECLVNHTAAATIKSRCAMYWNQGLSGSGRWPWGWEWSGVSHFHICDKLPSYQSLETAEGKGAHIYRAEGRLCRLARSGHWGFPNIPCTARPWSGQRGRSWLTHWFPCSSCCKLQNYNDKSRKYKLKMHSWKCWSDRMGFKLMNEYISWL